MSDLTAPDATGTDQTNQTAEASEAALAGRDRRIGRWVGLLVLLLPVGLLLYTMVLAIARPVHEERFERLDATTFASRMRAPAAVVINVHTPYEGEIEGTDLFIPYDRILTDPSLPRDKGAELLLYCRSGRMAVEAAGALAAEGYVDVSVLEGGMNAWRAKGFEVIEDPTRAAAG